MVTREDIVFSIKRLGRFFKLFVRNKRGMLGVSIIMTFVIITFSGPLITPYTPLGWDPNNEGTPLSGRRTAPTWFVYLPPELGGTQDISQNIFVNGTTGSFGDAPPSVSWTYSSEIGNPLGSGPGSFEVNFQREEGEEAYGQAVINLTKEFDFPYSGRPGRFRGNIDLLVNGTIHLEKELYYEKVYEMRLNPVTKEWMNVSRRVKKYRDAFYWDIPIEVHVFMQRANGGRIDLWPRYYPPGFPIPAGFVEDASTGELVIGKQSEKWVHSKATAETIVAGVTSEAGVFDVLGIDPVRDIFTKLPGEYVWGVEVIFDDSLRSDLNGDGVGNETDKNIIQSALGSYEPTADLNGDKTVDEADLQLWEKYFELDYTKGVEATVYIDDFQVLIDGTSWGLLGTDDRGRDLFAQLIYGTRTSLYVGVLSSILGVTLGLIVGLSSGYLGKLVDEILMRVADMLLVLPGLPLLIVMVAVLGTDIEVLILLLGFLGWMGFSRLVRSQVLSLRERPFVEAAKAVGAGSRHIIIRHILPNVMSLVYVNLATAVPGAIVAEASLAWLGFFDPKRMSWGRMLHDNFDSGAIAKWWWAVPPGLCIAALAIAFILIGYSLDEILNPRLRERR